MYCSFSVVAENGNEQSERSGEHQIVKKQTCVPLADDINLMYRGFKMLCAAPLRARPDFGCLTQYRSDTVCPHCQSKAVSAVISRQLASVRIGGFVGWRVPACCIPLNVFVYISWEYTKQTKPAFPFCIKMQRIHISKSRLKFHWFP